MRLLVIVVILVGGIVTAYLMTKESQEKERLAVIQPKDIIKDVVAEDLRTVGVGHRIGTFSFENQYNKQISLEDVKGKVFVAEYFFTTCGTICPIMTKEMMRVQDKFRGNKEVAILSFTVDPEYDNSTILREYAEAHNAEKDQWHFLTGSKEDLYRVARRSFFVLKPAEARNLGDAGSDFIHTNNFVLVDQNLRIRGKGFYDGTSTEDVDLLMKHMELLLAEN
ncbi:MAG: SCO family protein [Lishizhenia sp.]